MLISADKMLNNIKYTWYNKSPENQLININKYKYPKQISTHSIKHCSAKKCKVTKFY